MKPNLLSLLLTFALLPLMHLASPVSSLGCSCGPTDTTPRRELEASSAVFVGEVIGPLTIPTGERISSLHQVRFNFRVLSAWKGITGSEITVDTGEGWGWGENRGL